MKDYETLFISATIKSDIINWSNLNNNILLGYAALCFQQIAQNYHNYTKKPLLEIKKSPKTETYFVLPTDYLINLVKQNPFFKQYYKEEGVSFFNTRKAEFEFPIQMKNIKDSAYVAYQFMHECYRNEIYYDEIEHICTSASTYFDVLDEKRKIEKLTKKSKLIKKTNNKNKI
jgi:hypothetical protein